MRSCTNGEASLGLKTYLSLDVDGAGVKTLVRNLLAKTTAAFAVGANVAVSGLQVALKEPCAHLGAKTGALVHGLGNEDELGGADGLDHVFIDNIEGALVDETDVVALLAETLDSIEGAVEHLTVGDNVAEGTWADDFVLAWDELVALAVHLAAVLLEQEGNFGAGGEDEAETLLVEDAVDDAVDGGQSRVRIRIENGPEKNRALRVHLVL